MNSIIVLLLLSASVASAQSATSKAAACIAAYDVVQVGTKIISACTEGADQGKCIVDTGGGFRLCTPKETQTFNYFVPKKAKPKPSVKKKAAPECLGGGCDPGINPPSESSFIHCPETGCPTDLPESIHVIVDPKPQEEPKKDSLTGFGTNTPIVFQAAPSEAKGDAIQLKDDPSKLCDALSPTEKISCLMNIVAPAAPESTSPMPVYVREPVTQVVAHCPEGWHVEVWRPAFNSYGFSIDPPMLLGWDAGYVADNRPIVISMTIDKEHPDRCAVDVGK